MTNRDTITDFVDYLTAKEDLVSSLKQRGGGIYCPGEEELLASYLTTLVENRHGFVLPADVNAIQIEEGQWEAFKESEQRTAQLAADEVSYVWDALIEEFNKHILGGTSYYTTTPAVADRERIMHFLAAESRVHRRVLAGALLELVLRPNENQRLTRVLHQPSQVSPTTVSWYSPNVFNRPNEEYRRVRGNLLEALLYVTKLVFPEALDIIGVATDPAAAKSHSEDSMYLNARDWSAEAQAHARNLKPSLIY